MFGSALNMFGSVGNIDQVSLKGQGPKRFYRCFLPVYSQEKNERTHKPQIASQVNVFYLIYIQIFHFPADLWK